MPDPRPVQPLPGRGPVRADDGVRPPAAVPPPPSASIGSARTPAVRPDAPTIRTWLAIGQGGFYFVSGIWPLVHLGSFLAVTGPKTDLWLVQTVGALLAVQGAVLLLAGYRHRVTLEWVVLAAGTALVLALVDIVFVARDVIAPIYLADAAVELVLVFAWAAALGAGWSRGEDA